MSGSSAKVVIVGGGFAGLSAAGRIGERHDVVLIDAKDSFECLPNIHEIVSKRKTASQVRLSLASATKRLGQRFHQERVVGVDVESRKVACESGREYAYDALLLAPGTAGSVEAPGAAEHACTFHSAADAERVEVRLRTLLDEDRRVHVTIVGGGFTGVEVLGELLREHRNKGRLHLRIVESKRRLMGAHDKLIHRTVVELAEDQDVDVHTGARVTEVTERMVTLSTGSRYPSDLTIWTTGGRAPGWMSESGLVPDGARWSPTSAAMQSKAAPSIFIAGDAAGLPKTQRKLARVALGMGPRAGENLLRFLKGKTLRKFRDEPLPMLLTFGDLTTFMFDKEMALEDPRLAAGRELLYHSVMGQLEASTDKVDTSGIQKRFGRALRKLEPRDLIPMPGIYPPWL